MEKGRIQARRTIFLKTMESDEELTNSYEKQKQKEKDEECHDEALGRM